MRNVLATELGQRPSSRRTIEQKPTKMLPEIADVVADHGTGLPENATGRRESSAVNYFYETPDSGQDGPSVSLTNGRNKQEIATKRERSTAPNVLRATAPSEKDETVE